MLKLMQPETANQTVDKMNYALKNAKKRYKK